MELVKFFQSGGAFMYPILVVMALGLAIALDRLFYLSRTGKATNKIWKQINPMLKANDFGRAQQTVAELGQSHLLLTSRSEEHTSELQSRENLVCRLLLEKKKK